ncbi:MAG: ABC-2 family transporter protein, partial [Candidatus Doudnabacteria bacterium]|nr:ABC-2 family transporter protein [Candidatus Doudnabacteria bacterium]
MKYTFAREVEFRGDFLSYTFVNLLWAGFSVFIMGLFYTQTDNIAGWGLGEAFTLLATWHVVNAVLTFFVRRNFSKLPDEIKDGDLDVIVTKPVNMQFFVSLKHIDLPKIFNLLFAIALLVFGMSRVGVDVTLSGVLAYIILVIAGIMIGYSLWFGVLTLSFKYLGMSNLEMLF